MHDFHARKPRPAGAAPATPFAERGPVVVGLGEARVTRGLADVLLINGLGSGIALCARDPAARVCGMAHVVLPSGGGENVTGGEVPPP